MGIGERGCEDFARLAVTTNVLVRSLDLVGPGVEDNRRLEVVADGFLFSEVPNWRSTRQWSVYCMLMATYPELAGFHGRARFVVLGVEVGGRWSHETQNFLTVGQSKGQGRNRVDATTCGAVVALMGFILVMHCRSGGGFHDVGIAWRSRRRW